MDICNVLYGMELGTLVIRFSRCSAIALISFIVASASCPDLYGISMRLFVHTLLLLVYHAPRSLEFHN